METSSRFNKVEQAIEELDARLETNTNETVSLQKEFSSMKVEMHARDKSKVTTGEVEQQHGEHRIFTHIQNKAMREKIEHLVTETLDKKMSYAQVIEYLVRNISGKTADTIAAHPSLVKEYIRYRRENG